MADQLIRVLSDDGYLRGMAAVTTSLVEELRRRHGTDPTATVALGRLASGTALLGSLLKGDQRLALMIEGNGPLQKLHAETDASGHLRASIRNPLSGLAPSETGFPVADAIGRAGFLHVVKDLELKEPYRSLVQLTSSEVAEDLAWYLTSSEQVPSSVSLGVQLRPDGSVEAAGGLLVQALPGCPDALLEGLETQMRALPPVSALLREGLDPAAMLTRALDGYPFQVKAEIPLMFRCSCSLRQITGMLRGLAAEDRRELAARSEPTEVTCEYCRSVYRFTPDELAGLY